ncbi:MAG: XRE family transcriptional regulator [Candidatus Competibacteraceae bacterium]|nr:XRE family transcriptional regulator [Candidatus Competibacteraceae bacterium]
MIEFEQGSINVYADLGFPDAGEMLRKAELATEIGKIVKARQWTQQQAAEVMGLSQPKLSELLRGRFRGISESKMLDYLTRLGCDVEIAVSAPRLAGAPGRVALSISA